MRRTALVVFCLVFPACFLGAGATGTTSTFTIAITGKQGANPSADHFEAGTVTGFYNTADNPYGGDGGWSIAVGSPSVLDTTTCKGLALGFAGPPLAGSTWSLDLPADAADAGITDGRGRALLSFTDGCLITGVVKYWRATSGTLTMDSVGPAASGTTAKAIAWRYSSATMVVDTYAWGDAGATGTFTADGTGNITVFASP